MLIAVWGASRDLSGSDVGLAHEVLVLPELQDPLAALRAACEASAGPVALVDGRIDLPSGWLGRLARAFDEDPDAAAVTPLDAGHPLLTPWDAATPAPVSADEADRLVRMYADRTFFPQRALSLSVSLWRRPPAELATARRLEDLADGSLRILTCDHVCVPSARVAAQRSGPLDLLRFRLHRALANGPLATAELRPDLTRTVLHVTHSWGGGTQRWISDLAGGLDDRRHLLLMSRGDALGRDCGQQLELRIGAVDSPPVRTWPLPTSIRSIAVDSPEHAAVLETVIRDWGVGQIVVSSLIGHGLAVLETGLPTLVVCHDYFPLWPNLDVDFEGSKRPFDRQRLIGPDRSKRWFPDLDVDRWETVREAYLERISGDGVDLVVPSHSVARNLARLEPALTARQIYVVPHALRPFASEPPPLRPRVAGDERPWRVVIPGRISPGKGKELVRALGAAYGDRVAFYLVGAGHDGHDFFGQAGFHVILQYDRDELPGLLEEIGPDFAVLASTVSETFSYTLSEMWALGLPVVATRRGALAERINDGVDGALFEPTVEDFGRLLDELSSEQLDRWRAALATRELPDIAAMSKRYAALLPAPPPNEPPIQGFEPRAQATRLLAGENLELGQSLAAARERIRSQELELGQRGSWGFRVSRELAERTDWARKLDAHLDLARERLAAREAELEERAAWARELNGELDVAREQLKVRESELEARAEWARQLDESLTRHQARIMSLQGELDDRTAWALELERDLTASREQVEEQRAHNEELRGELATLGTRFTELEVSARESIEDLERRLGDMTGARNAAQREYDHIFERHQQVLNSRSWQLTKPFRFAARLVRRTLDTILMRGRHTASLAGRTRRSLKVRGMKGTVARIEQEMRRPRPEATPRAQVAPTPESDRAPLSFPEISAPLVSVVIPVHNHYDHTHTCLESLLGTRVEASFEVVVVDDASTDETGERLAAIPGIVHLTNEENLGFVGTCNRGAEAARGEFLVFLNNDTAVSDGWLDALVRTFAQQPDAGLVGAKLVYPDGRLQEAGGIVFADGSGWNYGRFGDPDDPAFQYVREVDYCSGAAICIRRELFAELGAFDQRYAPAYYEDTDLAFAVRAHGLRVYYQPAATVTHFEGVTAGTDTGSGTKRYQVINQQKFLDKWRDALSRQCPPGIPIQRARDHGRQLRALVIDACTPEPDKDSGSIRMVNMLALLRELGYQVTFFADNRAYAGRYSDDLQQAGVETLFHPWVDHSPRFFEAAEDTFDVAILSRHYVASNYIDLLRRHCPRARILFDTVDLHYLREQRLAELEQDAGLAATARKTREQELGVARRCDVTLVVSPYEQSFLAREAPELDVAVVSNIHRVHGRRVGWADRRNIMFVGGYQHPPNIDAVSWFAREIFPAVRQELPEVVFHIIGSKAPGEVERLGELDGVEFHGFVEDIEPYLDNCRLAVAPLRYGAGVKGKVNSSMSYGQPVIATTPAVEGMSVRFGEDVLVADDPAAFAQAVIKAYRDEGLWQRLSDGGLDNVRRYFSFEAARESLAAALATAPTSRTASR